MLAAERLKTLMGWCDARSGFCWEAMLLSLRLLGSVRRDLWMDGWIWMGRTHLFTIAGGSGHLLVTGREGRWPWCEIMGWALFAVVELERRKTLSVMETLSVAAPFVDEVGWPIVQ
ncbi:hypothetical protein ACLOJK_023138, partial [Asimina triloba]